MSKKLENSWRWRTRLSLSCTVLIFWVWEIFFLAQWQTLSLFPLFSDLGLEFRLSLFLSLWVYHNMVIFILIPLWVSVIFILIPLKFSLNPNNIVFHLILFNFSETQTLIGYSAWSLSLDPPFYQKWPILAKKLTISPYNLIEIHWFNFPSKIVRGLSLMITACNLLHIVLSSLFSILLFLSKAGGLYHRWSFIIDPPFYQKWLILAKKLTIFPYNSLLVN